MKLTDYVLSIAGPAFGKQGLAGCKANNKTAICSQANWEHVVHYAPPSGWHIARWYVYKKNTTLIKCECEWQWQIANPWWIMWAPHSPPHNPTIREGPTPPTWRELQKILKGIIPSKSNGQKKPRQGSQTECSKA